MSTRCTACSKKTGDGFADYAIDTFGIPLCLDCQGTILRHELKTDPALLGLFYELRSRDVPVELEYNRAIGKICITEPKSQMGLYLDPFMQFPNLLVGFEAVRAYHLARKKESTPIPLSPGFLKSSALLRRTADLLICFYELDQYYYVKSRSRFQYIPPHKRWPVHLKQTA